MSRFILCGAAVALLVATTPGRADVNAAKVPSAKDKQLAPEVIVRDRSDLETIFKNEHIRRTIKETYAKVKEQYVVEAVWFELRLGPKALPEDKRLTVEAALAALQSERAVVHYTCKGEKKVLVSVDGSNPFETDLGVLTPKNVEVKIEATKDGYKPFVRSQKFSDNDEFEIVLEKK